MIYLTEKQIQPGIRIGSQVTAESWEEAEVRAIMEDKGKVIGVLCAAYDMKTRIWDVYK
jgi:hypothetical protein